MKETGDVHQVSTAVGVSLGFSTPVQSQIELLRRCRDPRTSNSLPDTALPRKYLDSD